MAHLFCCSRFLTEPFDQDSEIVKEDNEEKNKCCVRKNKTSSGLFPTAKYNFSSTRENLNNNPRLSVRLLQQEPEDYRKFLSDNSIFSEQSFDEEECYVNKKNIVEFNQTQIESKKDEILRQYNYQVEKNKSPSITPLLRLNKVNNNDFLQINSHKFKSIDNMSPIHKDKKTIKIGQTLNTKNNLILNDFNDKIESLSDSELSQLSQIYPEDFNYKNENNNMIITDIRESNVQENKKNIKIHKTYEEESVNSKVSFGNKKVTVVSNKKKKSEFPITNIKIEKKGNKINVIENKEKKINYRNKEKELDKKFIKKSNNKKNESLSIFTDSSVNKVKRLRKNLNRKNKKKKENDSESTINSNFSSLNLSDKNKKKKGKNKNFDNFFPESNQVNNFTNPYQLNYPYFPYMIPMGMPYQFPHQMQMSQFGMPNPNFNPYASNINPQTPPYINTGSIPINTNFSSIPYCQTIYNSQHTVTPPSKFTVVDTDPNSCNYCEEIYKYTIMNNFPLKIMACLYCNKMMNSNSLEFYLRKYREELESHYKKVILGTNENKIENSENNECSFTNEDEFKLTETKSKDDLNSLTNDNKMLKDNYLTTRSEFIIPQSSTRNERGKSVDNINIKNKDESVNMILDTTDTVMSLAEIFKQKRAKLLTKIENRTHSVRDSTRNKSTTDFSEGENIEMKNISKVIKKKKEPKFNIDLNSIEEEEKKLKNAENKVEPSSALMDRLINGKKAKMSQKEIKEVNQRLYKKLVEVKYKIKEDNKRNEFAERNLKRKEYTDNLKKEVVKTKRGKQKE